MDQPIICNLVKQYDLDFNILKADVTPEEEGLLVLGISGEAKAYKQGIEYLEDVGVNIQPLSQDVVRNDERCTHCGACVTSCSTGALAIDTENMKVAFDNEKCIACGLCIKACPVRAMEIHF